MWEVMGETVPVGKVCLEFVRESCVGGIGWIGIAVRGGGISELSGDLQAFSKKKLCAKMYQITFWGVSLVYWGIIPGTHQGPEDRPLGLCPLGGLCHLAVSSFGFVGSAWSETPSTFLPCYSMNYQLQNDCVNGVEKFSCYWIWRGGGNGVDRFSSYWTQRG